MTRQESKIAAVILAMVAASVALLLWGMRMDSDAERLGPLRSLSAGGRDHVAVFHGNHLHILDGSGRRVSRQPLLELQLTEEPNDMDWTVDPAGRTQAWFFEDTTPRLVRCDLAVETMRLERCAQAMAGPQLKINARSRAVHFAVDIARQRVFIADAKGHAVQALDLDGRVLGQSIQGDLFFPNRLRIAGDSLMVADNDHRRLVWLDVQGDKPRFVLRKSLHASAHPEARSGHAKVTDFALVPGADGQPAALWMLAVAQGQKDGDLLVWGPAGKAVGRASQGGHSDPLGIDRLGDAAVVADFDGVALYRVGAAGDYLGPFGDEAFRSELKSSRDRIAASAMWVKAGWVSFAASVVIGFLLAARYSEKPGSQAASDGPRNLQHAKGELPPGPIELRPLPWHRRQAVLTAGGVTLLFLALPAMVVFLFPHELPPALIRGKQTALLGAAFMALLLLATGWWLWRIAQRRLLLANGTARVLAGNMTVASAHLLEVLASPQALLIGGTLLPYRGIGAFGKPGRWIYDEEQITRYLLAHLPPDRWLAHPDLSRAMLKRMPLWQKLSIGAVLGAFVAFELWRAFGR